MISSPQKAALAIGKTGCYFLCICKLAELIDHQLIDPIEMYQEGNHALCLAEDCTVMDAGSLLSMMIAKRWTCIKAGSSHPLILDYQCKEGEYEVLRYERPPELGDTKSTERAHFVIGDGKGNLAWDPWEGSHTVAVGAVVSKRIFRRA